MFSMLLEQCPVVSQLLVKEQRNALLHEVNEEYGKIRETHKEDKSNRAFVTLEEARENKLQTDWLTYQPKIPEVAGVSVFDSVMIETLKPYIDWSPFFLAWEMKGKFPDILNSPKYGSEAKKLYADAEEMLEQMAKDQRIYPKGVLGIFPANSVGDDDIEVYADESRAEILQVFYGLRQQSRKRTGVNNLCLADYIAPKNSGVKDYLGMFVVTAGAGADEMASEFEKAHDDYRSIMVKALADRLAEAFAEYLHTEVREKLLGIRGRRES